MESRERRLVQYSSTATRGHQTLHNISTLNRSIQCIYVLYNWTGLNARNKKGFIEKRLRPEAIFWGILNSIYVVFDVMRVHK